MKKTDIDSNVLKARYERPVNNHLPSNHSAFAHGGSGTGQFTPPMPVQQSRSSRPVSTMAASSATTPGGSVNRTPSGAGIPPGSSVMNRKTGNQTGSPVMGVAGGMETPRHDGRKGNLQQSVDASPMCVLADVIMDEK